MSERAEAVDSLATATARGGVASTRVRRLYFAISLLIAGIVAFGFWATYYARPLSRTDLPSIVHVHAAVFTAWVLVLVAQAAAVAAGNVRLHRRLGAAAMGYGALVAIVGLAVSVGAPAARVSAGQMPLDVGGFVVIYNLCDLLLFAAFLALSFGYRNRPELHKRWVIAASAALCGAALGRVVPSDSVQYLLLWLAPILAMLVVDLVTQRRIHAIPLVSAALLVVAFFKVPLFAAPVWSAIGVALLRPLL